MSIMDQEVDFAARCLVAMSHAYQTSTTATGAAYPAASHASHPSARWAVDQTLTAAIDGSAPLDLRETL